MSKSRRRGKPSLPSGFDCRLTDDELPINATLVDIHIAAPGRDGSAVATKTLRDDPLGRLHARNQINNAQYAAGEYMREMFELMGPATVRAMDFTKPSVDGRGQQVEPITQAQQRAAKRLHDARHALGHRGFVLMREVLCERKFLEQIAAERGIVGDRAIRFLATRFREDLEVIAEEFGFVSAPRKEKHIRDRHSADANLARSPALHRAVVASRDLKAEAPQFRVGAETLTMPTTKAAP